MDQSIRSVSSNRHDYDASLRWQKCNTASDTTMSCNGKY